MNPRLQAPFVPETPTAPRPNRIAVIVPVYKGAAFLDELVERLHVSLQKVSEFYQIVLVDDRGGDRSWELIEAAAARDGRVVGIRLSRNFGQHPAISAGIAHADADWYVVMDCDLQDPPECIPDLFREAVETGLDVVVAQREESGLGRRRDLGSVVFNGILRWASDLDVSSRYGNFRIFSERVAQAVRAFPEQLRLFPALISHAGFSQGKLLLPRNKRPQGGSSYSFSKLVKLALENIIAYSEKPLWMAVGIALFACMMSGGYGLYIIARKLMFGFDVAGFATLAVLITFIGGLQLFVMSLVGLYVGRAIAETRGRPIFIVEETTVSALLRSDGEEA